jgi:hypothetical protein
VVSCADVSRAFCPETQVTFRWTAPLSGPFALEKVCLRASFDNWKRCAMEPTPDDEGEWVVTRMAPATRFHFVFEVDGIIRVAEDIMFMPTANSDRSNTQVQSFALFCGLACDRACALNGRRPWRALPCNAAFNCVLLPFPADSI